MSNIKYNVVKVVSAPKFELPIDKEMFIKFLGNLHIVQKPEVVDKNGKVTEPASEYPAALVIDLENGVTGELGLTHVLNGVITENYPNNSFVGKTFRVLKSKVEGKRYFSYAFDEIEIEESEPALVEETPKKK